MGAATRNPSTFQGERQRDALGGTSATLIKAYLYNADGHDRPVDLDDRCMSELEERNLLWVDVLGRDRTELENLARLLDLDPGSLRALLRPQDELYLDNYGEYFQFDVVALSAGENGEGLAVFRQFHPVPLEFLVGGRWVVTVHDEELPFLDAFREQDKGETLIGALSPAALVASLLDWHLTTYFEAVGRIETSIDRLDEALLTRSAKRTLLAGVVALRRRVSHLRRLLASQRAVFYGLSRPDFSHVVESEAKEHYSSLERRFERAVDSVDHARDLVNGSFQLFTSRTAESTNDLVRRLTFITMLLGAVGAVAGIFGMNFEVPFFQSGGLGFWSVIGVLILFTIAAMAIARMRNWI
jgi:Mg2+ and Co2+ transporter CorA